MPLPQKIRRLGQSLLELGGDPRAYQLQPPRRALPFDPLGQEPGLGLGEEHFYTPNVHGWPKSSKYVDPRLLESTYDNGKFIRTHNDPELLRKYINEKEHGVNLPTRDPEAFTEIDSLYGAGPLGGTAEYIRSWSDDELAGRYNISTALTPINKVRRPINALQFQMRQPSADVVMPYRGGIELVGPLSRIFKGPVKADDWLALDPDEKLGLLAAKSVDINDHFLPAREVGGMDGLPLDFLWAKGNEMNARLRSLNPNEDGPLSAFGAQTLVRNEMMRRLMDTPDDPKLYEFMRTRPVFKRAGGRL